MVAYRYPGGKTKIAPKISNFFRNCSHYAEPFVGGGSVISEVINGSGIDFLINDLDCGVFSFWYCLLNEHDKKEFFKLIECQQINLDTFYAWKNFEPLDNVDRAFKSLFLNRTSFSGLGVNPIGGKNQSSKWDVGCRYNPKTIISKCITFLKRLDNRKLDCTNMHFSDFLTNLPPIYSMYLDPPYFYQGKNLYKHFFTIKDHELLAMLLTKREGRWLLSYDDSPEIRKMYDWALIKEIDFRYSISGEKKNWTNKKELLISPKEFENDINETFALL